MVMKFPLDVKDNWTLRSRALGCFRLRYERDLRRLHEAAADATTASLRLCKGPGRPWFRQVLGGLSPARRQPTIWSAKVLWLLAFGLDRTHECGNLYGADQVGVDRQEA